VQDLAYERRVGLGLVLGMCGGARGLPGGERHVEQVLWNRKQDRSRPPLRGHGNCSFAQRDDVAGLAGLGGPLHERLEGPNQVHLLEGLAASYLAPNLADDGNYGSRIGLGGVQPDCQVGGAGGAAGQDERRPAGQLSHRLGHERRCTLVSSGDDPDSVGSQTVEQSKKTLARNGEGDLHARSSQRFGQGRADRDGGARVRTHRHCRSPSDPRAGRSRAGLTGSS
jgi:hypothetical protein